MLTVYTAEKKRLKKEEVVAVVPPGPLWLDLQNPTKEEEVLVERALTLDVPTREEMQEIEISSRLYQEGKALFMTATILSQTSSEQPEAMPVTFILTDHSLITIRYNDPKSFQIFSLKAQRAVEEYNSGETVLVGLLEAIVDRIADVLEGISNDIDAISHTVFSKDGPPPDYQEILRRIGKKGDLNSKVRESLVTLGRLFAFLSHQFDPSKTLARSLKSRIKTVNHDAHSLTDHSSFISSKINFLLDATLGMISIGQNNTIKIFSVAAVVFLPPTLVASIYGMNFDFMPELKWLFGYPFAVAAMILSAIVPYWYFKRRGWL